jgi:hypothetical protein
MKHFFLAFFILISLHVYSQPRFYLHPSIEYKFDTNDNLGFDITTPQNYTIQVKARNFTAEQLPFLGLQIGYNRKNWFFETGWAFDKFACGITVKATVYDMNKHQYYTKERRDYNGSAINKIPLRLGIRLFGKDSIKNGKKIRYQAFIFGSLDLIIPIHSDKIKNDDFIINPQGNAVNYNYSAGDFAFISLKKTIGFTLKTYTNKGRNINYSISYLGSSNGDMFFTRFAGSAMIFTNYDQTKYNAVTISRGSGFYIGISTDLYFKNMHRRNNTTDYYRK